MEFKEFNLRKMKLKKYLSKLLCPKPSFKIINIVYEQPPLNTKELYSMKTNFKRKYLHAIKIERSLKNSFYESTNRLFRPQNTMKLTHEYMNNQLKSELDFWKNMRSKTKPNNNSHDYNEDLIKWGRIKCRSVGERSMNIINIKESLKDSKRNILDKKQKIKSAYRHNCHDSFRNGGKFIRKKTRSIIINLTERMPNLY